MAKSIFEELEITRKFRETANAGIETPIKGPRKRRSKPKKTKSAGKPPSRTGAGVRAGILRGLGIPGFK